jgi:hypothetical protein
MKIMKYAQSLTPLTWRSGVDLPLMVEWNTLQEGDEKAGNVCQGHNDNTVADKLAHLANSLGQAKVVNKPASFQNPEEGSVQEQANDMRLGAVDSKPPLLGIRVEGGPLLLRHCIVREAPPVGDDEVRGDGFGGVDKLVSININ